MDAPPLRLPPILADGDLVLDAPTVADAEAHAAGEDREMRRRFDAPDPDVAADVLHVRSVMARWAAARAAGGPNVVYAIRHHGVLAGGCELRWLAANVLNVSYWIYPAFRGRGLAVRAVRLLCAGAAGTGARQIEAHVDADNEASRRTAEAAGFLEAGQVEDETWDGRRVMRVRHVRPVEG